MAKKAVKTKSKKTPKTSRVSFRQYVAFVVAAAVLLFGVSGWLWWDRVLMNPDKALQDMLGNSLHTTSVTKVVSQTGARQAIRVNYESEPLVRGVTEISQSNQTGSSSVTTETLGTKQADYVRYTNITTNGQPTAGVEEILNVWASQESTSALGVKPVFLNEASLSLVPFGNLNNHDAQKIIDEANKRDVYSYDAVQTKLIKGRPVLIYSMSVKASDLIAMLKVYYEVTGIGDVNQLNPDNYANARELNIQLAIDALSRQLVNISYPDAMRNEEFNGYGIRNQVALPTQPISVFELQNKVQSLSRSQSP